MKKFFLLTSLLLYLIIIIGCTSASNEEMSLYNKSDSGDMSEYRGYVSIDYMMFTSMEELLVTRNHIARGRASDELSNIALSTNFLDVNTMYMPINIPEPFNLDRIFVNEVIISFWYRPHQYVGLNCMDSDVFMFTMYRWDLDNPLEGILAQSRSAAAGMVNDYIYFDGSNSLFWAIDRTLVTLQAPFPSETGRFSHQASTYSDAAWANGVMGMVNFTSTMTLDLTNPEMIYNKFGCLDALSQRLLLK